MPDNATICILTSLPPADNPRALKEAMALAAQGYAVSMLTTAPLRDDDERLAARAGFSLASVRRDAASPAARLTSHAARHLHRTLGYETRWQLGHDLGALYRRARAADADLYLAHLEAGLWAGARLLREGRRLAVDIEDWYSEDLLPEARAQRPLALLRRLEGAVLRGAVAATTTSAAMSGALAASFACARPSVVYNAFAWTDRDMIDGARRDRTDSRRPSIHWVSKTLGDGRGLDDLVAALHFVDADAELHLRGQAIPGFEARLKRLAPDAWRGRIVVHAPVAADALLSRIAEHDIGFAGEQTYCRNKDLTASNKILHYLLGGLAVVASDTQGQREIAEQAQGSILLYPPGDVRVLAGQLNTLLGSAERLTAAKEAALAAAKARFCWERQEPVLLAGVAKALHARGYESPVAGRPTFDSERKHMTT